MFLLNGWKVNGTNHHRRTFQGPRSHMQNRKLWERTNSLRSIMGILEKENPKSMVLGLQWLWHSWTIPSERSPLPTRSPRKNAGIEYICFCHLQNLPSVPVSHLGSTTWAKSPPTLTSCLLSHETSRSSSEVLDSKQTPRSKDCFRCLLTSLFANKKAVKISTSKSGYSNRNTKAK